MCLALPIMIVSTVQADNHCQGNAHTDAYERLVADHVLTQHIRLSENFPKDNLIEILEYVMPGTNPLPYVAFVQHEWILFSNKNGVHYLAFVQDNCLDQIFVYGSSTLIEGMEEVIEIYSTMGEAS